MKTILPLFLLILLSGSALLTAGCSEKKDATPPPGGPPLPAPALLDPTHPDVNKTAPAEYKVKVTTSKGDFTVHVYREWAPRGADRFYNLISNGFYDEARFFRVVPGFMAQIGIHADPRVSSVWQRANIPDDPVKQGNLRSMLSFATSGPNSRSTQFFINFSDNTGLDSQGFPAFGKVSEGMDVVDKIHAGYGESPNQGRIQSDGNEYLKKSFPDLDYVKTARVVQ